LMLKILLQVMNILNMLGWDFSVSPKSLSTDFTDYPVKVEEKRFHPDEMTVTKISSRLNRRWIYLTAHLTGQVGQVGQAQIYAVQIRLGFEK